MKVFSKFIVLFVFLKNVIIKKKKLEKSMGIITENLINIQLFPTAEFPTSNNLNK
jgi:hypothetical protein